MKAVANINECMAAGVDPTDIERIANGLGRYSRQAEKLGLTIFGGSGNGKICRYENHGKPLVLADIPGGQWEGGAGDTHIDDDGLERGEGD